MRRRDFVQRVPAVTAGLALGGGTLPLAGCAGAIYVVPTAVPEGLAIPAAEAARAGGVFVQAAGMERPVWVGRSGDGEVVALLASCTHQGCQPEPLGQRLVCPCHGSEFSFTGDVLEGPAERPLTRYEVLERGGELVVRVPRGTP